MWNFSNLSRPVGSFGRPSFAPPASRPLFSSSPPQFANRANGGSSRKDAMVEAGIYKGAAVVTAGAVGAISAFKGLPEIKGTMGLLSFDVIAGVLLSGVEFAMLWKGKSGKAVATLGGVSTGLLCHFAAVQGTIWGAGKARAEAGPVKTEAKGVDYDAHDRGARQLPQIGRAHV